MNDIAYFILFDFFFIFERQIAVFLKVLLGGHKTVTHQFSLTPEIPACVSAMQFSSKPEPITCDSTPPDLTHLFHLY